MKPLFYGFVLHRQGEEMMRTLLVCAALAVCASQLALPSCALAYDRPPQKPAIVLAAFGTTEAGAVHSIMNIMARVEKAFPGYDVHLAFTSNIIRNIWHKRAGDAAFRNANPDIPEGIYAIRNALTTLADIQEHGARLVLVQSLHVTDGEEYNDLANLVKSLEEYKTGRPSLHPFPWIGVGEPALGVGDGKPQYLERAAAALAPLARKALETDASLVFLGHGNELLNQGVFARLEETLRKKYGPNIYIGTVEAEPFAEDIVQSIRKSGNPSKRIFLAPLMVVAGDHALNDMAGDEDDSWANIFKANGFEVEPHLLGLGSNDSWADIYVEHLKALEPVVLEKKARDAKE
jgi:sirohydrochlorin cobaltochelatase